MRKNQWNKKTVKPWYSVGKATKKQVDLLVRFGYERREIKKMTIQEASDLISAHFGGQR